MTTPPNKEKPVITIMNLENPSITQSVLRHLHDEITELIHHIHKRGLDKVGQITLTDRTVFSDKSVVNLAQYLALRELDLRPLQKKLAEAGLSSLDSLEPNVFASLKSVLQVLSHALGNPAKINFDFSYLEFEEGNTLLQKNAYKVLGDSRHKRIKRIMATLPSEAAADYKLVYNLIREGMDIARINCAHDDLSAWRLMIDNIRRAATELDSQCRILMDLAGHKVRGCSQ